MIGRFIWVVKSLEGHLKLQGDTDVLVKWAEKWQIEFNPEKCKMMHFGSTNEARNY